MLTNEYLNIRHTSSRKHPRKGDSNPPSPLKEPEAEEEVEVEDKAEEDVGMEVDPALDVSLHKDIEYSKEVWLFPIDLYRTNLNVSDKKVVLGKGKRGWLTDNIIDYCSAILKKEYPEMYGLESVLEVGHMKVTPFKGPGIQIVNTGNHWLVVSTIGCQKGEIEVFDSAGSSILGDDVIRIIAKIMPPIDDMITLNFVHCDQQKNNYDCVFFAICNVVAKLLGDDPSELLYPTSKILRKHLVSSMEKKN